MYKTISYAAIADSTYSTRSTLFGRTFNAPITGEHSIEIDTPKKLNSIHTVIGDIQAALNLPEPLAFCVSFYGEFYLPFYGIINSAATLGATTEKIDILKEEIELVDQKLSELKSILQPAESNDLTLDLLKEWIESLSTLKLSDENAISAESQNRLLYGGIGEILGCSKTATLLLTFASEFIQYKPAAEFFGKQAYFTLTKTLIPLGFVMAMLSALKSSNEIRLGLKGNHLAHEQAVPKDIQAALDARLKDKNIAKSAAILTNVGYAFLSTQTLHMTYGLYYIMIGLATLLGIGRMEGKVSGITRSLTFRDFYLLRNPDQLYKLYRFATTDLENFEKAYQFYKKTPQKIPVMYALSLYKAKTDYITDRIAFFQHNREELKNQLTNASNPALSEFIQKQIEMHGQILAELVHDQKICENHYLKLGKFVESLSPFYRPQVRQSAHAESEGFAIIVDYMRQAGLEKEILSAMPKSTLHHFVDHRDKRTSTIAYHKVLASVIHQDRNAQQFIKDYLNAARHSMRRHCLKPKINLRNELLEVIATRCASHG